MFSYNIYGCNFCINLHGRGEDFEAIKSQNSALDHLALYMAI